MKVCLFSLDKKIWYCTKLNIIFWVLRIKLLVFLVLGTEFSKYAEYLVLWWNAILGSTWDGFPKQDSPRKQLSTRPPPGRHPIDRQGMAQFCTNSGTGEQHRGPGTQSQLQHNHTAALLSVLGAACPEIAHKAAHTNRREPRQSGVGSPCHSRCYIQAVLQRQRLLLICTRNLVCSTPKLRGNSFTTQSHLLLH